MKVNKVFLMGVLLVGSVLWVGLKQAQAQDAAATPPVAGDKAQAGQDMMAKAPDQEELKDSAEDKATEQVLKDSDMAEKDAQALANVGAEPVQK